MDKWGALQRQDVVPDKISRTLLKESRELYQMGMFHEVSMICMMVMWDII
jgi:hypothetical protein